MNNLSLMILVVNAFALVTLRREWAPLPLLIGSCYMTLGQAIEIGPLTFFAIRILIAVGLLRIVLKGERLEGGLNSFDWLIFTWFFWTVLSGIFHENASAVFISRLGLIYNALGLYLLLRIFCPKIEDVVRLCRVIAIIFVPIALEMLFERAFGKNLFSFFGGISEFPAVRDGNIRAQGPFRHSILAGTVGAVSLPYMIGLWHRYRGTAIIGIIACVTIIYASASSGPVMSAILAVGGMWMWRYRSLLRFKYCLVFAILVYLLLDLVMRAPAYYLLARIDIIGGSTGWHRAKLIRSSLDYIGEWWLYGTAYTRHWMPYGVPWSNEHADITNQYIMQGVLGGIPLLLLFIAILLKGFFVLDRIIRKETNSDLEKKFIQWSIGASLLAHTATFISVTYFDQSIIFFYITLAAIGSSLSDYQINAKRGVD